MASNSLNDDQDILVHHAEHPDRLLEAYGGGLDAFPPLSTDDGSYSSVELPNTLEKPPADSFNFSYLVFYLLGTATMTPWNFFITAEDYWMYKFRNTTLNDSDPFPTDLTPLQKNFPCDLTITATISGTAFLILNAIYGHHVSLRIKMVGTLALINVIFCVTTAFVEINTDSWQLEFFYLTLGTVIIINISSAVMTGGLFGIAGLFPSEYMTAVSSGQSLGGVFTSLAFILALAFGASPRSTAVVYFSIGNFVILLSIITYEVMSRQVFFKYYVEGGNSCRKLPTIPYSEQYDIRDVALEPNLREVFRKVSLYAYSICILFAITLSVYPAVSVLTQSENFGKGYPWNDIYFMPVTNYLCFNSGDYLGRIIAGIIEKPRNSRYTILFLTFTRILFIPFFLMSNTNIHKFLPVLVHSDVAFIFIIITFALTNGYLANIILITAPRLVMHHEKEMASSIMAASLSCGLTFGAALSMLFVQVL